MELDFCGASSEDVECDRRTCLWGGSLLHSLTGYLWIRAVPGNAMRLQEGQQGLHPGTLTPSPGFSFGPLVKKIQDIEEMECI